MSTTGAIPKQGRGRSAPSLQIIREYAAPGDAAAEAAMLAAVKFVLGRRAQPAADGQAQAAARLLDGVAE